MEGVDSANSPNDSEAKPAEAPSVSECARVLILGILGIIPLGLIGAIPAVICARKAIARFRSSGGAQRGRGLAEAGLALGSIGIAIHLVAVPVVLVPTIAATREIARRTQCMSNLSQVYKALAWYSIDHDESFPDSFLQLTNSLQDPRILICPRSGHKPGPIDRVDEWTDYVLCTNVTAASPAGTVAAYCRPENHVNKGCNVLFADGTLEWADPATVTNLGLAGHRPRKKPAPELSIRAARKDPLTPPEQNAR